MQYWANSQSGHIFTIELRDQRIHPKVLDPKVLDPKVLDPKVLELLAVRFFTISYLSRLFIRGLPWGRRGGGPII